MNKKTRIFKLLDEKYRGVGSVYHGGANTIALLSSITSDEILIIAPAITHDHIKEFRARSLIVSPQKYMKSPTYPEFILWMFGGKSNGIPISTLLVRRER